MAIPRTMTRLYCLALKFQIHIEKMDKENPLYIALHPPSGIRPLKSKMVKKIYSWDELFTDYKFFGKTQKTKEEQIKNIEKG